MPTLHIGAGAITDRHGQHRTASRTAIFSLEIRSSSTPHPSPQRPWAREAYSWRFGRIRSEIGDTYMLTLLRRHGPHSTAFRWSTSPTPPVRPVAGTLNSTGYLSTNAVTPCSGLWSPTAHTYAAVTAQSGDSTYPRGQRHRPLRPRLSVGNVAIALPDRHTT